jgi:hypothetical protein
VIIHRAAPFELLITWPIFRSKFEKSAKKVRAKPKETTKTNGEIGMRRTAVTLFI